MLESMRNRLSEMDGEDIEIWGAALIGCGLFAYIAGVILLGVEI